MQPCHELACRRKVAASCRQAWTTCPLVCECADTYVSSLTTGFQFYLWFRMIWSDDNGLWVASEQYTDLSSPHTRSHARTHTHTHTHTHTVWIVIEGLGTRSSGGNSKHFLNICKERNMVGHSVYVQRLARPSSGTEMWEKSGQYITGWSR